MAFLPSSSALAAAKTIISNEKHSMKKSFLNEVDNMVELIKEEVIDDEDILDPELIDAEKTIEEESKAINSSDDLVEKEKVSKKTSRKKKEEKEHFNTCDVGVQTEEDTSSKTSNDRQDYCYYLSYDFH